MSAMDIDDGAVGEAKNGSGGDSETILAAARAQLASAQEADGEAALASFGSLLDNAGKLFNTTTPARPRAVSALCPAQLPTHTRHCRDRPRAPRRPSAPGAWEA